MNEFEDFEVEEEDVGFAEYPFDPSKIDISSNQISVFNVVERLKNDEINLTPDFQRRPNLWKPEVQSRLIESLILGIPLQAFYFDAQKAANVQDVSHGFIKREVWQVVDGLQRLSAIKNFILSGRPLVGMEYLVTLNNKTFDELPAPVRRNILETTLLVYLIKAGTPEEIKFNIFKRVNTGGMPLTQQEIRHALFNGKGTELLLRIADSDEFRQTVGFSANKRMLDREFVNRYLAFYVLEAEESYRSMEMFLNDALRVLNKMRDDQLDDIYNRSRDSLRTVGSLLGDMSFRRLVDSSTTGNRPINKAVFETVMAQIAKLTTEERAFLRSSTSFDAEYRRLWRDESIDGLSFDQCVAKSTGDRRRVLGRHMMFRNFLNRVLEKV